ncbi:helix-turn-helix transcriptional regulator [Kitasatospora sp. NPDC057198]|uniref:helix-turn-helix transcriptional regulator n=1 Tax=Kitasatospora sp. NPDC057198 TaxID=3346046 RepID=UPI0036291378
MNDPSPLAARRRMIGYAQQDAAREAGVDRRTWGRWERGEATPYAHQLPRLAAVLKISVEELDVLLNRALGSDRLPGPTPAAPSLDDLDTAVADWAGLSPSTEPVRALWVTEQDLAMAGQALATFRQLDHTYGARQNAGQVADYIERQLHELQQRPAASPEIASRRALLTAEFCELAGYQAVDNGEPEKAQRYYRRALHLASATGDRPYGAYLTAVNLGHLALHCGQPETALRWASAARTAAGTAASPFTRAAIAAVVARANARLQREHEATKLILEAEKLLDRGDADEPDWIRYFTHPYLADEVAHCLHDLGRPPAARSQLVDALHGVGPDRVRRRAIDAALLATTWLASGDLDQACAAGTEAVEYAARTGSGRCVTRVTDVLDALRPHADHPTVRELLEFTEAVLPAALTG